MVRVFSIPGKFVLSSISNRHPFSPSSSSLLTFLSLSSLFHLVFTLPDQPSHSQKEKLFLLSFSKTFIQFGSKNPAKRKRDAISIRCLDLIPHFGAEVRNLFLVLLFLFLFSPLVSFFIDFAITFISSSPYIVCIVFPCMRPSYKDTNRPKR